jgi:hypothetical protein
MNVHLAFQKVGLGIEHVVITDPKRDPKVERLIETIHAWAEVHGENLP